ncbi:hypothetical protein [Paenibacillus antarcticus]|uniref:DUF4309 domain-containing protein n=1 Tax=Paenibacillus antarcticus TaxID=253703 RepID=A0A162PY50_9BACL|nr:hypothetical protein [Paenibacillus antarcticus]OAB40370.1 hypothetical protein PBAT_24025 [Paenibacillus antarcticus]
MKWKAFAVITACSLVFGATGGQVQWNEDTKTIAIISATQTKEAIPTNGEVKERDQKIIEKMNEIKKKLKLGLTKEEVQALFNEKFEITHNSDSENGSDSYWKYEYFKATDYQGESDTRIDVEGLMERKLGAFLYIEWKKNKLYMYSISYLNPKDHKVHLYMMGYDGKISDVLVSD